MKILSLCFCNDYFPDHSNRLVDIKFGLDVLTLNDDTGRFYDLILAAPPCDQFTKANNQNWVIRPSHDIDIAQKCFDLCINSGKLWVLENPPGRIETFIPDLKKYRTGTYQDAYSNKEYVLYSNTILLQPFTQRYGRTVISRTKSEREKWTPGLVEILTFNLAL